MLDKHENADNRRTTFFLNFESKLSRNTRPLHLSTWIRVN
jgi:hypothetical protein